MCAILSIKHPVIKAALVCQAWESVNAEALDALHSFRAALAQLSAEDDILQPEVIQKVAEQVTHLGSMPPDISHSD